MKWFVVESAYVVSNVQGPDYAGAGEPSDYTRRVAGDMPVVGMASVQLCTVVFGGAWSAWWCLECLVVLGVLGGAQSAWVVALSHKNHDLHLDVRCCNLLLMENPRHSSHKSEPITPWPPQLPQLTRQAIPPSPISLQHPCPRSRQTMPIMGLSEFCRRRLSPSSERAGDIPLPAPPTRETRPAGN